MKPTTILFSLLCLVILSSSGCELFTSHGGEGQPCFIDNNECKPGLVCVDGKCVSGTTDGGQDGGTDAGGDEGGVDDAGVDAGDGEETCTDDCSTGETTCIGNGYATCGEFDDDECLDWSEPTDCGLDRCADGQCVPNSWARSFADWEKQRMPFIVPTADGGYYLTGDTRKLGHFDALITRLDHLGNIIWQKSIGGPDTNESLYGAIPTPGGGIIAAGSVRDLEQVMGDGWIVEVSETGEIIFQQTYGTDELDESFSYITRSPGDGYLVAGDISFADSSGNARDIWIVRLYDTRAPKWQIHLGYGWGQWPRFLAATTNNEYVVSGPVMQLIEPDYILRREAQVIRLDDDGQIIWHKGFSVDGLDVNGGKIRVAPQGGIYLPGNIMSDTGSQGFVAKLNSTGTIDWLRAYSAGPENDLMELSLIDNGIIVGGSVSRSADLADPVAWILQLDLSGNITWEKAADGAPGSNVWRIEQTTDQGFIAGIGGSNIYVPDTQYVPASWILKLAAGGELRDDCWLTMVDTSADVTTPELTETEWAAAATSTAAITSPSSFEAVDSVETWTDLCTEPECSNGQALCGWLCVDLDTDPRYCGSCSNECNYYSNSICIRGECQCKKGYTECWGNCYDTDWSNRHCGECENSCSSLPCIQGECSTDQTCEDFGLIECYYGCADPYTDEGNCGGCDIYCLSDEACINGLCVPDPCKEVTCDDPFSHCEVGICLCNPGYHDEGGICVENTPCYDVTCIDPNSHCEDGICVCNTGFQEIDGICVACCGNGHLNVAQDACICDADYNDNDGDLRCGPDIPVPWPPELESLWNGDPDPTLAACTLPACDECGGYPGNFDFAGTWTRTTTTLTSTCDPELAGYDPRVEVGYIDIQEGQTLGVLTGNCLHTEFGNPPEMVHTGTLFGDCGVNCSVTSILGLATYVWLGSVQFDPGLDTGVGEAKIHVVDAYLWDPCEITLSVSYVRE